ncbi:response regulator transcription factor [Paremcibacter congregatus]|uniref:response regulator transcription factor n=1 Tax=Paremcibacter congregatus TaxID=2043170 RepID=UPI0030ED1C09
MKSVINILVVEDELEAAEDIRNILEEEEGWRCRLAGSGAQAVAEITGDYDVIILDRMLPDMDGIAFLSKIRREGKMTPVLILSNLGQLRHRIDGLDEGADDYLPKPFASEELVARVRTLLRRSQTKDMDDWVTTGGFLIHKEARTVHFKGQFIRMSAQEFSFLTLLCESPNDIVSRELIWQAAWPAYSNLPPRQNVIDVGASRLRKKLEKAIGFDPIDSIRGVGFRLKVG